MKIYSIVMIAIVLLTFSCKNNTSQSSNSEKEFSNEQINDETIENKVDNYDNKEIQNEYSEGNIEDEENNRTDCSDVVSSAEDAFTYCSRAYNSDDYEEVKSYLNKAMNSFDDAMSYAEDCNCDDAYSSSDDGYTYTKRGYNSDDFEEMKDYAKKAKNSADETISNADECSNN